VKPEAKPDAKPETDVDAAESFRKLLADALAGSRAPVEELPKSIKELQELVDKANAGDRTVMPKVRTMLDTSPADALLIFDGDPGERRRLLLMHFMAGGNAARKAALAKHISSMRRKLIGKDASVLVRLMAERVLGHWLEAEHLDTLAAADGDPARMKALNMEERRDRANRRLHGAIEALNRLREVALPALKFPNLNEPARSKAAKTG